MSDKLNLPPCVHTTCSGSTCTATKPAIRVFEIEARTRYRIAAHSAHEALERLHDLDTCTAFSVDANADIQFIASCSVAEDTIEDMTDEDEDDPQFGLRADHRRGCDVCQT